MIKQDDSWQEAWGRASLSSGFPHFSQVLRVPGLQGHIWRNLERRSGGTNEQKIWRLCFTHHHGFKPWGAEGWERLPILCSRGSMGGREGRVVSTASQKRQFPGQQPENKPSNQKQNKQTNKTLHVLKAVVYTCNSMAVFAHRCCDLMESNSYQKNACLHAILPSCLILRNAV